MLNIGVKSFFGRWIHYILERFLNSKTVGLSLARCKAPTKASCLLPSEARQGKENIMKVLWPEIETEISLTGKTNLNLTNKFNYLLTKSEEDDEK